MIPDFANLLAKSCADALRPPSPATLRGHIMLVCRAADTLLDARATPSLRTVGLPEQLKIRLERIVRLGAFVHDLGKCSDQFQQVVRKQRVAPQLIRHEAASLWLCWPGQPLAQWLRPAVECDEDMLIALAAAAGHHRKFWSRALCSDGAGTQCQLLTDHADFIELLRAGGRYLRLKEPPHIGRQVVVLGRNRLSRQFETWSAEWDRMDCTAEVRALARVAKALVLCADVAGSALPRADLHSDWIEGELRRRPSAQDLAAVAQDRLGHHAPRKFQLEVAASSAPVTFVRGGCGSGKTVAAYLWATQYEGRQLWVTYPTTGTTTEGYRDYVAEHSDLFARLEHGRRAVDLELLDVDRSVPKNSEESARQRTRIEALGTWGAKVVVCTVDTVLGLVQNHRKGLYGWPGLSNAALVFDEIHAYDDALFGALLRFLEAMPGTPVLLMTASLPSFRLAALRELVSRLHRHPLMEIDGPPEFETHKRYQRSYDDPFESARSCLAGGRKVLWVSNTVERCIAVEEQLPSSIIYHSRFRYVDRIAAHRAVIAAFEAQGAASATTTQVAEMSLDLSANLLVTEIAPVPALIQRLGRLNRRATPTAATCAWPFIVVPVPPEKALPYKPEELAAAWQWLARLGDGPLSQADLVESWKSDQTAAHIHTVTSTWIDGGYSTEVGDLRLATPGLTVLREQDVAAVRRDPAQAIACALPMGVPQGNAWKEWPQVEYLPVAPAAALTYDPKRGGRWR